MSGLDHQSLRIDFQIPHTQANIRLLLRVLVAINRSYLRAHPETPALYQAKIIYQREPPGHEQWRAIPQILADGFGDCEDLSCWRAAELLERGKPAEAFSSFKEKTDAQGNVHRLYHIRVRGQIPDRRVPRGYRIVIEDPSRRLGMGDAALDLRAGAPTEFAD